MDELSVQEWKIFLRARILQEQGNDQEALKTFDKLLGSHPHNPHLMASRAFALQRLGKVDEAAASRIAANYAVLGTTLVGSADDPEVWTAKLKSLLGEVDRHEGSAAALAAAAAAW